MNVSPEISKEILDFILWLTPCGQCEPAPTLATIGKTARALYKKIQDEAHPKWAFGLKPGEIYIDAFGDRVEFVEFFKPSGFPGQLAAQLGCETLARVRRQSDGKTYGVNPDGLKLPDRPPLRAPEEIQRAHDLLTGILCGDVPGVEICPEMHAALDGLCWVLHHDHNTTFADNLKAAEDEAAKLGFTLYKGPKLGGAR